MRARSLIEAFAMLAADHLDLIRILLMAARPDPSLWQGPAAQQLDQQLDEMLTRAH